MQQHVRIESGRGDSIAEKYCPKFLQPPQHLLVRMRLRGKSNPESAIQFINYSQSQTISCECDGALAGLLYEWNVDLASPFAKGRG